MILVVSLNPAVDIRYSVPEFQPGNINRPVLKEKTAGGKGLNAARVLSLLGYKPLFITGFSGGKQGEWIQSELDCSSIPYHFQEIKEETRTCIAILSSCSQTEVLEAGPEISESEMKNFIDLFRAKVKEASLIILSGSLPKGVPADFYRTLGEIIKLEKKRMLLDSSGESLKYGIEASPFLIKPNLQELSQLLKRKQLSVEEAIKGALSLCEKGVCYTLVSLGSDGAILASEKGVWKAVLPSIEIKNPVGSGDSMLAGAAFGMQLHLHPGDLLRFACACGTANAAEEKTGFIKESTVMELYQKIQVEQIFPEKGLDYEKGDLF
ncbi:MULTISPECIES: 1-phosphofructokinase family hexose kinase [Metabacillus]|uniref:1-phosphofructokinase family hexose kinase n=1 Tax=Metabacillus hrfriensis TaxID=3048891 RepID=A0ACD4RA38_9BACI|nr:MULTISPECIES: 1-phosphofructokinase family hexose kinase [Metabacillus]UAL51795.1 1-phosphofructokinase family hexose kinase [Metabacillus dongyingensis]USK28103.1 1-phosphofructokinase family hexose kinase [Bacillus sp. CMF21]WHZ57309.1 1-phosphofructokinase family hexose kinase [Metabacillus sp. CT-WN-B3]